MAGGYNPYYSDVTYVSQGQEKPQQTGYAQMQNTQNYNFYQQQMYNQQLQQQLQQGVIQQTIQQQQQAQLQQQPQFQQQQVQQTPFVKPSTPIFQNIANMYAEKNKAAQAPVNLQAAALAKLTASSTTSTPTPKTSAESTPVQAAQNKIEIKFALPTTSIPNYFSHHSPNLYPNKRTYHRRE